MSTANDNKRFILLFIAFIVIECLLYTLIVYLDLFNLTTDKPIRNPAFMIFYCLSAFVFFMLVRQVDKK